MYSEKEIFDTYIDLRQNMPKISRGFDALELSWSAEARYNRVIRKAVKFWKALEAEISELGDSDLEKTPASEEVNELTHDLFVALYELSKDLKFFEFAVNDDEYFEASVALRSYLSHGHAGRTAWYVKLRDNKDQMFKWALGMDLVYILAELGHSGTRLFPRNSRYLQKLAARGDKYANLSELLEETITVLQEEYQQISNDLLSEANEAIDFLRSDMDLDEPLPDIVQYLIGVHIDEDEHRQRWAAKNEALPLIVPEV